MNIAALMLAAAVAAAPAKTVVNQNERQAPAGQPSLQLPAVNFSQSDLCDLPVSGAYGNSMLAVTLDLTHRDVVCARLRQSWFLSAHGYTAAAVQLQCLSAEVRLSMQRAGTPCEAQVASPPSPDKGK